MPIEGAILDFDGTLVDSLEAWRGIESELARQADVVVTSEDRALLTTFTLDETAQWFHERFGLRGSAAEVRQLIDDYMVAHLEHSARLMPGVGAFLEQCRKKDISLIVASSSPQLYLQTALRATGILSYFEAVLSVEDIGCSKREERFYDHAREIVGTKKHVTWGFDDSLYAIDALRAAGYPTVGVFDQHEGKPFEQWRDHADVVIRSFEDLSFDQFDRPAN